MLYLVYLPVAKAVNGHVMMNKKEVLDIFVVVSCVACSRCAVVHVFSDLDLGYLLRINRLTQERGEWALEQGVRAMGTRGKGSRARGMGHGTRGMGYGN